MDDIYSLRAVDRRPRGIFGLTLKNSGYVVFNFEGNIDLRGRRMEFTCGHYLRSGQRKSASRKRVLMPSKMTGVISLMAPWQT